MEVPGSHEFEKRTRYMATAQEGIQSNIPDTQERQALVHVVLWVRWLASSLKLRPLETRMSSFEPVLEPELL